MSGAITIPKRRISGGMKAMMLTVALLCDFAVAGLLVIGVMMSFSLAQFGGDVGSQLGRDTTCFVTSPLRYTGGMMVGAAVGLWEDGLSGAWQGIGTGAASACAGDSLVAVGSAVGGAVGSAATAVVVGGTLFYVVNGISTILSVLIAIFSFLLFSLWFALLRVYVFAPKTSRVGLNILTGVIELVPFINGLPMQTVNVFGHIYIANKEDKKRIAEATAKLRAQETRDGFMQGRAPRRPSREAVNQQMASEGVYMA